MRENLQKTHTITLILLHAAVCTFRLVYSINLCGGNVCLPFKVANFSCNNTIYVGMPIFRCRKQNYITPYESHTYTTDTLKVYDFNFFSYYINSTTTTTTTMHTHFYLWHNQPFNSEKSKQICLYTHTRSEFILPKMGTNQTAVCQIQT